MEVERYRPSSTPIRAFVKVTFPSGPIERLIANAILWYGLNDSLNSASLTTLSTEGARRYFLNVESVPLKTQMVVGVSPLQNMWV